MNGFERAIAALAPQWALRRAHARAVLAQYEAARPSRHRRIRQDGSSADVHVEADAATLRSIARNLERNHDISRGVLNVMTRNIVGPRGIGVEPTPRLANDDIHDDFARALSNLWLEFCESPSVTGTRNMAEEQRLLCRGWLRDGDDFGQILAGDIPGLTYTTRIPLAIESLEADFCPLDYNDPAKGILQGIEINAWRRPRAYHLYKTHPGDARSFDLTTKRVPAESMFHLRMADRLSQLRGVSIFASVITRLDDLKDYEESERIAARIAASMAAYVKKGQPVDYQAPVDASGNPVNGARLLQIKPGTIFDDLLPGEEIGTISSDRPSSALVPFRDGQLRAVASGFDVSNSSLSRNYNGTYSAQRQELVEQDSAYKLLSDQFIAQMLKPVYRRFVQTVILTGLAKVPKGIRPETLWQAEYLPPVMPWIDPAKEIKAIEEGARIGFKPMTDSIRERGGSLHAKYESFARERKLAKELNLRFTSDPANDQGKVDLNAPAAPEPDNASSGTNTKDN